MNLGRTTNVLAVVVLAVGVALSLAWGASALDRRADSAPTTAILSDPAVLADWPDCRQYREAHAKIALCTPATDRVEGAAFNWLSDHLYRTARYRAALCEADDAIVAAQFGCSFDSYELDNRMVAYLMYLAARNWMRHGELVRAEQFFVRAYAILGSEFIDIRRRGKIVAGLAELKVRQGQSVKAKELTHLRVEIERWQHDSGWTNSTQEIVLALADQADILERLGFAAEAQTARQEAGRLSLCEPPCRSDARGKR